MDENAMRILTSVLSLILIDGESSKYVDALGAIIAALIALPVGMGIERYRHRQDKTAGRPARESGFLDVLANALSDMAKDINEGRIPHRSGHQFAAMLDAFGEDTKSVLGEAHWGRIEALRQLAQDAQTVDYLLNYGQRALGSPAVQTWLVDAEREIGEIRAESAKRAVS